MPLRFVRMKKPGINIDPLQAAITTTAFTRDLMATLQFPPVTAAVSVLLLILETIQVRRRVDIHFFALISTRVLLYRVFKSTDLAVIAWRVVLHKYCLTLTSKCVDDTMKPRRRS